MSEQDISPETARAFREMAILSVVQHTGKPREEVEAQFDSGTVTVHISGDSEDYFHRWNVWYEALSDEEQDAYHHFDDGEECDTPDCRLCAIRDTLEEPHVVRS